MDRSLSFRRFLLSRWAPLLDVALPAASIAVPACGGNVVVDGRHGNGGGGENGECCDVVSGECSPGGRPYLVGGHAQVALARSGDAGWADRASPDVARLDVGERAALAEAWARDGLLEHASVASFGRFALELLAAGAPAVLVAEAHRAAIDEVRHARLCFGLASAYAGEPIAPGPFDFGRGVAVQADLATIAVRTFLEGCVGETLAAVQAVEQLGLAEDRAVRSVLETIADDEARHAELAWRTVAWALKTGGERVRAALIAALGRVKIGAGETVAMLSPAPGALRAHGRLDRTAGRAAMERALHEVVLPCARGLLRAGAVTSEAAAAA